MADPFDVRMRFSAQLQHLNASVNSAQKAAHYAIKYKEYDEDLHSCILEQLDKKNMNNSANLMFFIEQLCDMAQREGHPQFIVMIQRDIFRIIDAVAPSDGSGAANVKVVRRVLNNLQAKQIISTDIVQELDESLKERDTASAHPALSPVATDETPDKIISPGTGKTNGVARHDKRQIEQRIEEDRERHKRLRESIWAVNVDGTEEFDRMWEETSSLNSDDFANIREEVRRRRPWAFN